MPENKIEVYEVVHTSPNIKTVLDYIQDQDSPAFKYGQDPESFLLVKNSAGFTNREVIENTYITKEEQKHIGNPTSTLLLKVGTKLAIERQKANMAGLLTDGLEVVSYDVPAFKAKTLADLESHEGYQVLTALRPIGGKLGKGTTYESYPDMTVWVWCRSLANATNNYEGEIFNITPFIEKASTNVTKNGGNFDISLPPLVCELKDGKWTVKKNSIQFYKSKRQLSLQSTGYVADVNLYRNDEDGLPVRNLFLFHTLLNTNDLVFIRFETLKLEEKQRIQDESSMYVSKDQLPERIYDMIGLIDINGITTVGANNDVNIKITGRDLSKLFIDDGTYFYFLELTQGMVGGPGSSKGNLARRLSVDNSLKYLSLYFNNTIDRVFKFVINQLSNITIVPDSLFTAYGDRRNTRYEETKKVKESTEGAKADLKNKALKSISNLRKRNKLSKSNTVEEKQFVEQLYREKKRFLQTIRDNKKRIVDGNVTMGWEAFKYVNERGVVESIDDNTFPEYFEDNIYNLFETRTVPEAATIVIPIDEILDIEKADADYQTPLEKKIAPGIWQIVKLVIDNAVFNRRIVDSSISSANGSLMNFFRKVCQEPFVEYFGDTYGDMYHLIIRKPPTDKAGVQSMLSTQVQTEEGNIISGIIDIWAEDVLYEDLSIDDTEAYSWYHFKPQSIFQGSNNSFSLAYLPAICFDEYAEIWGARPMQISHNYIPATLRDADQKTLSIVQEQAVEDMRFLIESTAYLPFTRKGVIKLNGDRRHKIGNIVRYHPTKEIFYVDSVRQEFSIGETDIERNTVLQVSRGMIEKYINGVDIVDRQTGKTNHISYFDIINTKPVYEYTDSVSYVSERIKVGETQRVTNEMPSILTPSNSLISTYPLLLGKNQNTHLLDNCPPDTRARFWQLINAFNLARYDVIVTSALRSREDQEALYRLHPNRAAKPGHSRHETGRAIDLNLIGQDGTQYTLSTSKALWLKTGMPQLAESMGFMWGGTAFSGNYDPVHFELRTQGEAPKTVVTEPIYEDKQKPIHTQVLDTNKIFSNFRVNKEVFNFFLRKEQFNV